MVTKEIPGDFADIGLAWAWLTGLGVLADDYFFQQTAAFTENTGVSGAGPTFAGHTVTFQGNGDLVTVTKSISFRPNGAAASLDDVMIFDGLKIEYTPQTGVLLEAYPWWSDRYMTVFLRNLKLRATHAFPNNEGIRLYRWANSDNVYNCKISRFYKCINLLFPDANTSGTAHIIENNSCYDSNGWGVYFGSDMDSTATRNCTIRSTVCAGSATVDYGKSAAWDRSFNNIINCADSDNSIAATGATVTAPVPNPNPIVPANEFESLDSASADFLKLKKGSGDFNASADKERGYYPLSVGFKAEALFVPGAPNLADGGTAPVIAGHNTDLAENSIPDLIGNYPIGAYAQEYL